MYDPHGQNGTACPVLRPERAPQEQQVSVIMANLNGQAYLKQAIRSVMRQTHTNLELVIVDDGSVDDSRQIIRAEMALDPRIRLIASPMSQGPAAARNRALAVAKGDWIAIVDSDDLIHPERLGRMMRSALALKSDMVADDIIFFGDHPSERNKTLLQDLHLDRPYALDAVKLVSGSLRGAKDLSLGYLKPLIRKTALGDLHYNETLLTDEDHDLYLRLLMSGASLWLIPDAMYLYRRHAASSSYRLSAAKLRLMIAAQEVFHLRLPPGMGDLSHAVRRRLARARTQLIHVEIVDALKAGNRRGAVGSLLQHPHTWPLLLRSLQERLTRRLHPPASARRRLKIVLGLRDQTGVSDYPDAEIVQVPDVTEIGWLPSAAATWAYLAHLSCTHDLEITAVERAGVYALGLVPRYLSARVISSHRGVAEACAKTMAQPVTKADRI